MNYKTQMEAAKKGIVTEQMKVVAEKENMQVEKLIKLIAEGKVVIPANINHKSISPEGIGDGLKTKINVNLGISGDSVDYCREMEKVKLAIEYGAEAIMDLSNYGKTQEFREKLIEYSPAMIGTVPMYDAIGYLEKDLLFGFFSDWVAKWELQSANLDYSKTENLKKAVWDKYSSKPFWREFLCKYYIKLYYMKVKKKKKRLLGREQN